MLGYINTHILLSEFLNKSSEKPQGWQIKAKSYEDRSGTLITALQILTINPLQRPPLAPFYQFPCPWSKNNKKSYHK